MRKQKSMGFNIDKAEMFAMRIAPTRTSKALCLAAAGLAFVIGTVIGVLIPLYVLPPLYSASSASDVVADRYQAPQSSSQNTIRLWSPKVQRHFNIDPIRTVSTTVSSTSTASTANSVTEPASRSYHPRFTSVKYETTTTTNPTISTTASTETTMDTTTPSYYTSSSTTSSPVTTSTESSDSLRNAELTRGVFWSDAVESVVPAGFDDETVENWRSFCNSSAFIKLEEGCGRMRNRLITFENGTRSCCRYRQNFDQIQGDIFSFLLSRLLGIRNLVPTAMQLVQPRVWRWSAVRSELSLAQWAEDRPVILTRFMDHLTPAYIPTSLQPEDRRLHPVDLQLQAMNLAKDRNTIVELAQWSDLIVFDYITANLDRIVNNLYNMQWNPNMMTSPTHNLARDPTNGQLIFLDNESGLLHGYRLLDKYEPYHRTMLDALCIFRRSTVDKIRGFVRSGNVGEVLRTAFRRAHPQIHNYMPTLPQRSVKILKDRLKSVLSAVEKCEAVYSPQ